MGRISRRAVLAGAGLLAGGTGSGAEGQGPRKRKVVVTGGHPGDPEYGCGGTIARYADLGHEVVLLYLNRGERPDEPPETAGAARTAEATRACEILKARPRFAGQVDGKAIVDPEHYRAFRAILEDERPDVLFTHWPIDNHADHRAISTLTYDAWLRMGKKAAFFYYEVSDGEDTVQFAPDYYVDISSVEPRKRAACHAHASQAPGRFYALQEQVMRLRGIESGHKYAEAFIRHVQGPGSGPPLP
ncbi:MAG TPA: PIG-L deacetylase family protein [Isosphaeraceae bacterium]|jgi:LmbE family N-acetylglucosaminyl deacetylase|nr:PIG-L deacetylase family protein [Isosphaeraceae bacterium]